ncbi:MAG: hypothetical protein IT580_14810 [Verrucomicrobiales bacterium]|nr:hypothetical protein [Verrucomicrobiales bacterium]
MAVPRLRHLPSCLALTLASLLLGACENDRLNWPPPPRSDTERRMIEAARHAVAQYDGWSEIAWVVDRQPQHWRVQAWRIVYPAERGRNRCAPYAVRVIELKDDGEVLAYRNHL